MAAWKTLFVRYRKETFCYLSLPLKKKITAWVDAIDFCCSVILCVGRKTAAAIIGNKFCPESDKRKIYFLHYTYHSDKRKKNFFLQEG